MDERCLICEGAPAVVLYFSVPPDRRVVKYGNGEPIPYTLCAACQGADIAQVDAALRRRQARGGDHGA